MCSDASNKDRLCSDNRRTVRQRGVADLLRVMCQSCRGKLATRRNAVAMRRNALHTRSGFDGSGSSDPLGVTGRGAKFRFGGMQSGNASKPGRIKTTCIQNLQVPSFMFNQ